MRRIGNLIGSMAELQQQSGVVKNARKAIYEIRDRLRGSVVYSKIFYALIPDPQRPPMEISGSYATSSFWSIAWSEEDNNYEPFTTIKYQDVNIGYYEMCAIYLLIQESYPNVYDFPNLSVQQINADTPVQLKMKKNFIGKRLSPASVPAGSAPIINETVNGSTNDVAKASFCTNCGKKLSGGERFCSGCGSRL